MLDPASDLVPPPSSPTISSVSSSDLDTEVLPCDQSTGSFFHDRSITLGTLMGVTFQAITFRAPSMTQNRQSNVESSVGAGSSRKNRKSKKSRVAAVAAAAEEEERRNCRRRRWWRLCRDECDSKPASLGEYLEVERRLGDGAIDSGAAAAAAAELEGVIIDTQPTNGRTLFADGRVLPPVEAEEESSSAGALGLCRFSVASLSGICSRGAGCVG
ncbi:uncharacterized protein At3g17950-like isoform X1 [Nicotiana tabacum]|uniref:Uncharacterized protein At3g17950-like isoform X1 n=1 Tax=Nicotiana tabacum TaxID=4097 RepID=A0A1S3YX84_TOBAC|nr:uncharacterized protein At3g17950 isoform X1 [Nicotiana tomentosiformis]XP_016456705.1 PREDICTED: uncharacterized protein At3g17950-like isoform X1 [Nicotiana tabacum]